MASLRDHKERGKMEWTKPLNGGRRMARMGQTEELVERRKTTTSVNAPLYTMSPF